MMRSRITLVLAGVLVALPLQAAQGPGLAEIARKEQERRKALKEASRVITAKDLPRGGVPAPRPEGDQAQPQVPARVTQPEESQPEEPAKDEAYWRGRTAQAREELRRNEVFLEALQSRVNALTTDFAARDDPYQRAQIGQERQNTLAEMERVRAEIAAQRKALAGLEEEARQAGVPPGWLR